MITNDGNNADTGVGQKVRTVVGLVLLAVISYEVSLALAERRRVQVSRLH